MLGIFSFLSWLPTTIRLLISGIFAFFILYLVYRIILAIKDVIPFV